ncbi:kinase-like domain-containing protein [Russula earlei]|uniref:Kinase-like domain-containing protein n=1 Tax=Russula earlei TaxID=71964 RepID=A0ACC0UL67_9AGAM|nr:kinase-like domain-containing protein [Russula earlei]
MMTFTPGPVALSPSPTIFPTFSFAATVIKHWPIPVVERTKQGSKASSVNGYEVEYKPPIENVPPPVKPLLLSLSPSLSPSPPPLVTNAIAVAVRGGRRKSGRKSPREGCRTRTPIHHRLLQVPSSPSSNGAESAPSGPLSPALTSSINLTKTGLPTTHLTLHAPAFDMQLSPVSRSPHSRSPSSSLDSSTLASSPSRPHQSHSAATPASSGSSKGQIHVKLISARGLNTPSFNSRPYVVVVFENNEFVSRDPTDEDDKEVRGVATNLSRTSSSIAISALGAVGSTAAALGSPSRTRRQSPVSSSSSNSAKSSLSVSGVSGTKTPSNGLIGRMSAHNPVWKHEVSFDVTSEESTIQFNIYDRADEDHGFMGSVKVKPTLVHDHTVDQWYKLGPYENEPNITGEIRIQITFEQYKSKRSLTPRDFEFLKLIGRGTFGRVFQVRKKDTKRIYAMKVLSKKEIIAKKEVAHTIGERKILQRSLDSPFLVGLKFSFQTDTDLYLITDFKSGGELFWHLQKETRFTEERARFYIAELVLALEHLHKYDIVYRDLKPENILLDATGHVALCDFGLSKPDLGADELTNTFCGTTEYLAPEVLLDEHGYSKLVDFWSLGVLLFEMCCGWSPFYAEDTQQMYKNICFGKIRFPRGVINEDGKQFVKGLLNRNPKHRLGAQRDAAELKEHPFFQTIDWDALARKQVTPPFKPVVESDESTSNFDPEFTSADISSHIALVNQLKLDDDDPSADWVSQSVSSAPQYTPHGPLGSDRPPVSVTAGIQIQPKRRDLASSPPLTNSVQENFRGFTYSGESESLIARMVTRLTEKEGRETTVAEEATYPTTDDETLDATTPAGRYSKRSGYFDDFDDI